MKTTGYLIIVLTTLFAAGCSEPNNMSYTPPSWLSEANTCESNGVKVTVDSFFGSERNRTYFDADAIGEGVFPVHVIAHNSNPNATILFTKANLKLAMRSGADLPKTGTGNRVVADGPGVLLFNPILASPLAIPYVFHNQAVQYNFARQELRDKTLLPGQSTEGFVYFQIPKGTRLSEGNLRITATNVRTQQDIQMEVPIIHDKSDR